MCRLGGVVLHGGMTKMTNRELQDVSANLYSLLAAMDLAQGGDGVGVSLHFPDKKVEIVKATSLPQMMRKWHKVTSALRRGANIVQMHARMATQGIVNINNTHPFRYGPVVGAHNGMIFNDVEVWNMVGALPNTQVDSEAIFGALAVFAPELDHSGVQEVLDLLFGVYAITAVSEIHPNEVHLIRGENPLAVRMSSNATWWASTKSLFPRETKVDMITEFDLTKGDGLVIRTDGKVINRHYDIYGEFGRWADYYDDAKKAVGGVKGSESCGLRVARGWEGGEEAEPIYTWIPVKPKKPKHSK